MPVLIAELQNWKRTDNCAWRGSPTPTRRKPSKLNSAGVTSGFTLFLLLKVLNISTAGVSVKRSPNLKGRVARQSKEMYSLSFHIELRLQPGVDAQFAGVMGCGV